MKTFASLLSLILATSCVGSNQSEEAEALVKSAFEAANPIGRTGVEAFGKGIWFRSEMIDGSCLQEKNWGFMSDPDSKTGGKRFSPIYDSQANWTSSTDKGYCVFIGNDPTLSINETNRVGAEYQVSVTLGMGRLAGWGECLAKKGLNRTIMVTSGDDSALSITKGELSMGQGACPAPLPGGEVRKSQTRPSASPSSMPTIGDVRAAASELDSALREGDFEAAVAAVSCYNLFQEKAYGSCTASDFIGLSPVPKSGDNFMEPPWSEGVFVDLEHFGAITADRQDATLFHVGLKHHRSKKPRTMAVQWVDGRFKVVAVVSLRGEGLTTPRFVYDLDRKDRRDIFERRFQGEKIDALGNSTDPNAEIEE
jgi:hypothetical protein